jgi:hypothetical protein
MITKKTKKRKRKKKKKWKNPLSFSWHRKKPRQLYFATRLRRKGKKNSCQTSLNVERSLASVRLQRDEEGEEEEEEEGEN